MLWKSVYLFVVLRYGRSCQEMCGTILWVGNQDNSTTLQSVNSMHWRPSFQRKIEIRGRLVKSMLSNCSEMLKLGTNWTTRYSMVSEQTCTIDHKMDQSLWQTLESIDLLHSSYTWIQTVLLCVKHCQTMQTGTVSRLWFCRRSWGFKIYVRWSIVRFWKSTFVPTSWTCKKQTSVSHSSTESEIISLDAGLRLDGITALDSWDLIVAVLGNSNQSHKELGDPFMNKREVRSTPHTIQKRKQSQGVINDLDNVDFFPQTSTLLIRKLCCMCLKTMKQWSRWSWREEARQWDMFPEPTELLLIGCSIESIWTPRSQTNTLTPKTNSQTYWPRGNFTRDEWNHLLCLFDISHFRFTNCSEVTAKSKPMMNPVSRCSERTLDVLASTASESPGKTRYESQLRLSSWNEQHQRTERPVLDAFSSSYSGWDADKTWSSQELKSDEVLEARTGRPVNEQPAGLFTQQTDRFIVDDDDMDSDTVAESEMSSKSRSFLHRVNERVRKIQDKSSKDAMQDIDKRSMIWWLFMSSTMEASVFMGQNHSDNLHSIKNTGKRSLLQQMFEIS